MRCVCIYIVRNVTYLNHCPQQVFPPIFLLFSWYFWAQFAILRKCQSCSTPLYLTLPYKGIRCYAQFQADPFLKCELSVSAFFLYTKMPLRAKLPNCPVSSQDSARSPAPKALWTPACIVFPFPTAALKAYFNIQNLTRQCGRTVLQKGNLK